MAIATRETSTGRPSTHQAVRPAPAQRSDDAVRQDGPVAAQPTHPVPARRRDYDAPVSPWPLILYLLFVILAVDVAFMWAGLRAAGAP
jgi:hypothetical protein